MIVFPITKINIGLRITSKRPDGYHDIETIFYPVSLCDALEFVVSEDIITKDFFTVTGIDTGGKQEDNLVLRTVRKLREKYSVPNLKIHLHKAIPSGAGLGGGSSDSACFIKALNRYFNLNINATDLKKISLEIGSDCPFFIDGIPSYATGRGELLKPVDLSLSGYYIILLNPGVGINTSEAYRNCRPAIPETNLSQLIHYPVEKWKEVIINDFEDYAIQNHPVIGQIKNELYNSGAVFSLMSGSGSTVYGLFKRKPDLPSELKKYVIFEATI
jgi:4-diphosphocytidyl-2-C-methyl-D-erythritol kinase